MTAHYIAYKGTYIALAAMQREYIPLFIPHANDLSITQGTMMRPPFTIEDEYAWFESICRKGGKDEIFAILYRDDPGKEEWRYIGHTGLHAISWPSGIAKTGSVIIEKSLHGKGCGTEAKLLLLYHAFYVKNLHKVRSEVKAFNGNSWGHLLKCGYQVTGRDKELHFHQGSYVDEIMLSVSRDDFAPIWKQYQESHELPKLTQKQRKMLKRETKRSTKK